MFCVARCFKIFFGEKIIPGNKSLVLNTLGFFCNKMRYERTKEKLILFSFAGFLSLYKRLRACVVEVWICWCSPLVTVGCC
jgi:hypothetical protein